MKKNVLSLLSAILAAVLYSISVPCSKVLLVHVPPTMMAAFLYLGAGLGIGILYRLHAPKEDRSERLTKSDLPYTVGMVLLDILAPVFLMLGIQGGKAANASLLGNFEIVATTLIALAIFRESVSRLLWSAILLITLSSVLLSFEGGGSFRFSYGSLLVLLATACWGLENNCTRRISDKSTYEIVSIKGLFSGGGALLIALLMREKLPAPKDLVMILLLGFAAYGLSIFLYVRAQRSLGAAKTSACYAVAPFVGTFLSFLLLGERLTSRFFLAFLVMAAGALLVAADTLSQQHCHKHTHTYPPFHHHHLCRYSLTHSHAHGHMLGVGRLHLHHHAKEEEDRLT